MVLKRWAFAILIGCLSASTAFAQDRPFKIFIVLWRGETPVEKGFRDHLAENGIRAEYIVRNVDQQAERLRDVVAEIQQEKPDLVYSWGTSVTLGLAGTYDDADPTRHVTDRPVLFTMVADPVGARIVPSFDNPGRNVTGTSHVVPLDVQFKAMAAYKPFKRIGHVYNPLERNSVVTAEQLKALAEKEKFELIIRALPVVDNKPVAEAIPDVLAQLAEIGVDYVYLGPDSFIGVHRDLFNETAIRLRLPVFASTELALRESRALMGLVSGYYNLGRFTAHKAMQILLERKTAAEIPVETLKRFSYVINIGVARELEFFPPIPVLQYAEVIGE